MPTPSPARTAVYRFYDAGEQLIYVGIATNPQQRWALHASTKEWWPEVALREIEWFPTRLEAEVMEGQLIDEHAPLYNSNGGIRRGLQRPAGRYWRPDGDFQKLIRAATRTEKAAVAARTALEAAVVDAFRNGASAASLARHVPWTDDAIYALAKSHGIPRLRQPTVGREADARRAESAGE